MSALLLGLIVALSACGNTAITMQEVYDANLSETLLKKHESVYARYVLDGEVCGENYLSKEYTYDTTYGWTDFMTDHAYYNRTDGVDQRVLLLSSDGLTDIASYRAERYESLILNPDTEQETIRSVAKKDDRITVVSFLDQEALKNAEEGLTSCNCEYVLDAKTYELISGKCTYVYDDGMADEFDSEIVYDEELPEGAKAFLEYEDQTEDLRTITIVSNPGSENEKSQSVRTPKVCLLA